MLAAAAWSAKTSQEMIHRASPLALHGPPFAVIPSVLVGGPLALLGMLFPALFGGWWRWLALLSVLATNSTLYFLHYWLGPVYPEAWWSNPQALWMAMTLVAVAGTTWAWHRHLTRVHAGQAPLVPGKAELIVLVLVSLVGLGTVGFCWLKKQTLLTPTWLPVFVVCLSAWAATFYVAVLRWQKQRRMPAVATETVMLTALTLACILLGGTRQSQVRVVSGAAELGGRTPTADDYPIEAGKLCWTFRPSDAGGIASSPLVVGDRVYVAAAHEGALQSHGAVYCLNRADGKVLWTFHDGKRMKPVFSSPCLAGDKLYVGEGFHEDAGCKLYCLKADSGEKVWDFATGSHTESSPCIADGKVYFGAGDEGVYCLDAATGQLCWNYPGLHVDVNPTVVAGRLYAGSGIGNAYQETAIFCLDAGTGKAIWRVQTDLPVWGSPAFADGRVYYGLGNGRVNESDPHPAGRLLCVDAGTGGQVWHLDTADAVLCRPTLDRGHVYFGSRDRLLYCLNRADGSLAWKRDAGGPVVASVALAPCSCCGTITSLFGVTADGQLHCLGANTGHVYWSADVTAEGKGQAEVYSTPAVHVQPEAGGERRQVFFGAALLSTSRIAALYCYEDWLRGGQD
jgi:outer membrane protein assembly factor BamB